MRFSSSPNRPEAWKEMKLVDICTTFTSGGTPSRKRPEYFENGTIPWVRTKELNDGIITEVEEFITPEALKNSSAKMLPKNTVLLAMYGATVGKLGVLGYDSSCNQACAAMVPKDGVVDFRFLYYLLLNHRELIISQATGGAQQNLSGELIKGFTFDFPTYKEQQAISEVLWKIDEKIAANNALSKTLEDIAQTIFKSWFIDFDPVKAKIAGEKPAGLDAATAALFPDSMEESELGFIPKGWEVKGIGDLGRVVTGKTPSTKVPEYWGDQIPFVTIPDMHDQILVTSTVRSLSQKGADSQRNQYVSAGATMVTCIATPGLVGYATRLCQTNQQINSVVPGNEYSSVWLFWHLRGLIPTLIRNSGIGTVFANLNKSDFSKIKSVTPTREVRDAFSGIVQPIVEFLETLNYESQCLRDIRDGILPRLISGELQIPEEMLVS